MRFRYLRDPLFLLAVTVYLVNRWVFKAVWPTGFVHDHLNDLLCLPVWVPAMLWGLRRLGLRADDDPPRPGELLVPLVVWSWWFEVLLPAAGVLGPLCVSDHRDILCYALGALAAGAFWRRWYATDLGICRRPCDPTPPLKPPPWRSGATEAVSCGRSRRSDWWRYWPAGPSGRGRPRLARNTSCSKPTSAPGP